MASDQPQQVLLLLLALMASSTLLNVSGQQAQTNSDADAALAGLASAGSSSSSSRAEDITGTASLPQAATAGTTEPQAAVFSGERQDAVCAAGTPIRIPSILHTAARATTSALAVDSKAVSPTAHAQQCYHSSGRTTRQSHHLQHCCFCCRSSRTSTPDVHLHNSDSCRSKPQQQCCSALCTRPVNFATAYGCRQCSRSSDSSTQA